MDIIGAAQVGHLLHVATINGLCDLTTVRRGIEQITRVHAFGENDQFSPLTDGFFGPLAKQSNIGIQIAQ